LKEERKKTISPRKQEEIEAPSKKKIGKIFQKFLKTNWATKIFKNKTTSSKNKLLFLNQTNLALKPH